MPKNKIPVILDVDTGTDDAIAIAVSLFLKNINVLLITTGTGNAGVDSVTKNTLNILQFINKNEKVKVAKGKGVPISKHPFVLQVHGKTGLGDFDFEPLESRAIKMPAVEAIHKTLQESCEKVTLISLGPPTNFAQLLKEYPEDKEKIENIVISGGLIEELKEGEKPYTSYNIAHDPDATNIILKSGESIDIVPSNMGHDAYLDWSDIYKTKITNQTGAMLEELYRSYHDRHVKNGVATHDMCAVLYVSNPEIFEIKQAEIFVENNKEVKTGILKFNFESEKPNSMVATKIDVKKAKKIYFSALKKMP